MPSQRHHPTLKDVPAASWGTTPSKALTWWPTNFGAVVGTGVEAGGTESLPNPPAPTYELLQGGGPGGMLCGGTALGLPVPHICSL